MPNAQEVLDWIKWDKERKANMTKEEWLCGLSTEEKAKWLSNALYACMRCGVNCHIRYCPFDKCIIDKEDALAWLKEKHE